MVVCASATSVPNATAETVKLTVMRSLIECLIIILEGFRIAITGWCVRDYFIFFDLEVQTVTADI